MASSCKDLITQFEGCHLLPYRCPAGVWTCGWGSTGRGIVPGQAWTQEYADRRRDMDIQKARIAALRACPGLPGARLEAITDFAYNAGGGNLLASTLRKRVNAGDWGDVPAQLRRWVYGGGKRLRGLARRREAEILLLLTLPAG